MIMDNTLRSTAAGFYEVEQRMDFGVGVSLLLKTSMFIKIIRLLF